jgi:integrase
MPSSLVWQRNSRGPILADYRATGDIYATKQLLGHADVSTTANIYVQGSSADLEEKLRRVWGE